MDFFLEYIKDLNAVSITIRLFLAAVCGGTIGLERGRKGQAAGCRTHMLVSMGAALVMMTNIFVVNEYSPTSDPTRIGAQVVSGIGFLGAGTILVTSKNQIRGLTTAAGLWASACMGLAVGVGFYELAIIGNIFIFAAIAFFNKFDRKVYGNSKVMDVYIEFDDSHTLKRVIIFGRQNQYNVDNVQVIKSKNTELSRTAAIFRVKTKEKCEHSQIIAEFSDIEGVSYIEEL
ncbi:MAG: MgtC/SapB family protein [Clostridium sp.]|nr:MgtC/SapB family protein [Clostridium sp.]